MHCDPSFKDCETVRPQSAQYTPSYIVERESWHTRLTTCTWVGSFKVTRWLTLIFLVFVVGFVCLFLILFPSLSLSCVGFHCSFVTLITPYCFIWTRSTLISLSLSASLLSLSLSSVCVFGYTHPPFIRRRVFTVCSIVLNMCHSLTGACTLLSFCGL